MVVWWWIVVVAVVVVFVFASLFTTVPEGHVVVTELLGVRWRLLPHGPHLLVPLLERPKQLHWTRFVGADSSVRERRPTRLLPLIPQTLDPPPLNVVCRGRVVVSVDTIVRWRVADPAKAAYASTDLTAELFEQLRSALSDAVARMSVDELSERPSAVADAARPLLAAWSRSASVEIIDVLVQGLRYPREIEEATHGTVARRIAAESAMAAQQNQQSLKTAAAQHDAELQAIANSVRVAQAKSELEAARLEAEATLARSNAVAEGERIRFAALVASGVPVPQDYLTTLRYSEAWAALAAAPNVQKVVVPYGAVPFLGSTGVLDVRQWSASVHRDEPAM